jgi:hypothetical protein
MRITAPARNICACALASILVLALGVVAPTAPSYAEPAGPAANGRGTSKQATSLSAPKLKVTKAGSTSMTITWHKVKGAKGYRVFGATKGAYKKLANVKATRYLAKKLSAKKTYRYYVIAYAGRTTAEPSNTVKKLAVRGDYTQPSLYGAKLSNRQLAQIRERVAYFVNTRQTWQLGALEKLNALDQFLESSVSYRDWRAGRYYNTAYGALVQHKGACSAYTRATKALCDGMGMPNKLIHTKSKRSDHQWNHVKIGKKYYIVDVQAADYKTGNKNLWTQEATKGFWKDNYKRSKCLDFGPYCYPAKAYNKRYSAYFKMVSNDFVVHPSKKSAEKGYYGIFRYWYVMKR